MEIVLIEQFNNVLKNIDKTHKPNLFLHVCCAPCSSAVLYKLHDYFNIYIIYYNPNIDTQDEHKKRLDELYKLLDLTKYYIPIIYNEYDHNEFLNKIQGYENEPEGGERCKLCFEQRLLYSYDVAKKYINDNNLQNYDNYLCTTLSISPHKDAKLIYDIGKTICNESDIMYLPSDFKKEDGFLISIRLAKKYNLYRQNYCGCEFSKLN